MEERSGIGYFLLGLGVGVAAGVLWAPRSGEETRQILAEKANESADYVKARAQEGKDYVRQQADTLRESATDALEKGRTTVQRQKENLTAAVEAGKQAYRDAVTDLKSAAAVQGGTAGGSGTETL
ncbi:MAG TPA: YtxH domain-containing protein [Bryobacteraceae bacterium]|jgi:gas vesicle protein|nr:YtxH domain-containing protein [Bryobacteraceae bacterium]